MNLDRCEASINTLVATGTVSTVGVIGNAPQQENLNVVLDHAMANVDTSLKYVSMMISHIGGPLEPEKDEPASPGVLGKSFALRSQLQQLNMRLEQLGRLL